MNTRRHQFFWGTFIAATLLLGGCATESNGPNGKAISEARRSLNLAERNKSKPAVAAGYYLDAARTAAQTLGTDSKTGESDAMRVYNQASGELTRMLRDTPALWNRTDTLASPSFAYHLHFTPGSRANGTWDPGYFNFFLARNQVKDSRLKQDDFQNGLGGILIGVSKPRDPRELFYPKVGVAAPVTSTLDFTKAGNKSTKEVTLTLNDPTRRNTVRMEGKKYPLAADFTAPLDYYPNPPLLGFLAMMNPAKYVRQAGIYMVGPYDPDRIPLLFVHGLISSPQMWFPMMNAIEKDPMLRGKFQFWVFGYPSGEPIALAGLQLRESLDKIYRAHPKTRNMVVVGHSMGGLVTQLQVVNPGRTLWDGVLKKDADSFYKTVPADNIVKKALLFKANPHIKEVAFICTPHYGANMATGFIGDVGIWLIKLPGNVLKNVLGTLGSGLNAFAGIKDFKAPNGIKGLSPKSPLLLSLNTLPIQAPFYSIIGNQGKRWPLDKSNDSVVAYWSSHLPGAQAEVIVPYPHGCCDKPLTIDEVKRILHGYLGANQKKS